MPARRPAPKRGWEEKAREALERPGRVPVEELFELLIAGVLQKQVDNPDDVSGVDIAHCVDSYSGFLKASNKDAMLDALEEVTRFHEEPE